MRTLATSLRLALVPLTMLAPFHDFGLSSASAQDVPARTHFQGRLTDASNNPLTGPNSFVFEIFDAPAAGAVLWTEAQPAVPVANGVFAVQLGAATPLPSTVFSGSTAYLQVTVNGNVMTPRERLVSVPFSHNTQLLSGRAFAAFVSTDAAAQNIAGAKTFTGTVFVPAPTLPGHAASKAYVDAAGGTVLLSSTNTWSGQNSFLNLVSVSSDLVITGVLNRGTPLSLGGPLSVAAGVTAASGTFTASGPAQFSLQTSSGISVGGAGGIYANFFSGNFYGSGAGLTGLSGTDATKVAKAGDAMTGPLTLSGSTLTVTGDAFSVGGSTLAVINGSVGIGTAAPLDNLEIQGSGASAGLRLASNAASTLAGTEIIRFGTYVGGVYTPTAILGDTSGADSNLKIFALQGNMNLGANTGGSASTRMIVNTSGGVTIGGTDQALAAHLLYIDGLSKFVVDTAGNVGVGTASPANRLDVSGGGMILRSSMTLTGVAAPAASAAGQGALYFDSTQNKFLVSENGGAYQPLGNAGTYVARTGDTMTGQLTNTSTVTVQGNAFSVGGSTLVVSGGKVGLGTTTPASALHVKADGASLRQEGDKPVFLSHNSSAFSTPNRRKIHIGWADDSRFAVEQRTDSEAGLTFRYLSFDLNNGNTGVGTSAVAPLATLHAEGNTPFIASSAGIELIRVTGSSVAFAGGAVVMRSTAATAGHAFLRLEDNAGIELLRAQQNGRIGLGTTAPAARLDVEGDARFGAGAAKSAFSATGVLTFPSGYAPSAALDAANKGYVDSQVTGGSGWTKTGTIVALTGAGDNAVVQSTLTVQGNAFSVGGSTLVIAGGNVGIGTTSPDRTLYVAAPAGSNIVRLGAGDNGATGHVLSVAPGNVYFDAPGIPGGRMTISGTNGNVGIGTTSPTQRLQSNGTLRIAGGGANGTGEINIDDGATEFAGNSFQIRKDGAAYWALKSVTAGNDLAVYVDNTVGRGLYIKNTSGNVGIGTTSPASKLHVLDGDIRVSTSAGQPSKGIVFQDGSVQTTAAGGTGGGWTDTGPVVQLVSPTDTIGSTGAGVTVSTHLIVSAGNVGIGATSPAALLEISTPTANKANIYLTQTNTAGGEEGGMIWRGYYNATTTPFEAVGIKRINIEDNNAATNQQRLGLFVRDPSINGALVERVSVRETGNVGIGTTGPGNLLHVLGSAGGSELSALKIQNDAAAAVANKVGMEYTARTSVGVRDVLNITGSFTNTTDATRNSLAEFQTANNGVFATAMAIHAGNVGIGTTGPGATLHISSAATAAATPVFIVSSGTAVGQELLRVEKDGGVGISGALKIAGVKLLQDFGDANRLFFQPLTPNQSLNISIAPNGASGTPGLELFKTDGNADRINIESLRLLANQSTNRYEIRTAAIGTGSLRDLAFLQGAADVMTLATTGSVGIGTTNPVTTLDVNGGATIRSSMTLTGVAAPAASAAGQGALYFDSAQNKFLVSENGGAYQPLGNAGTYVARTGDAMTGPLTMLSGSTVTVTGNAFSVGGSTLVVTGGRVGIGTASPGNARLAVRGAVDFTNQYPQLQVGDSATTMNINMGTGNDGGAKYGFIQSTESGVSNDRALVLQKYGGNVGVGTTGPGAKLEASRAASVSTAFDEVLRVTQTNGTNGGAGPGLFFYGGTNNQAFAAIGGWNVSDNVGAQDAKLRFRTAKSGTLADKMVIDENGSVGVGSTAPTSKLEVAGDIRTSGGGDLILNPAVSGATMYLYNDFGELNVTSGTPSQMLFTVKSGGNVGIGTDTPAQKLDVRGGLMAYGVSVSTANESRNALWLAMPNDFNHALYNDFSNIDGEGGWDGTKWNVFNGLNVRVGTSKTSALYIGSSGGVGIGTTAPANRLDVAGGGMILRSSMTLTGVAAPAASAAGQGALYFDSAQNKFLVSENGGAYLPLGNAGTYVARTGDAMTGPLTMLGGSTITVTGSAFSVGGSTLVVAGGNVGIGTTNPANRLEVALPSGALDFAQAIRVNTNNTPTDFTVGRGGGLIMQNADVITGGLFGIREINSWNGALTFYTHTSAVGNSFGTTFTEKMRIDSGGNVGIGTTGPAARLHVSSNSVSNVEILRLENPDAAGAGSRINFTQTGNQTGYIKNVYSAADTTWKMHLGVGSSSDLVTIRTDGNVGVGTTNPTERLQFDNVASGSDIRIARKAAAAHAAGNVPSSLRLSINDGGEAGVFVMNQRNLANTFNDQYIRFDTHEGGASVGERVRIAPNGNVGIGTTSPGAKLDVAGHQLFSVAGASITFNAGGPTIGVPAGNTLAFGTSGIERMRLDNLGNLGIGTTGPGHQLQFGTHFNGTVANAKMFVNSGAFNAWNGKIAISPDGNAAVASVISSYHDNTLNIQKLGLGTIGYSGVEQTMVLQNGNVGIGTTSPQQKLHVEGTSALARFGTGTTATTNNYWYTGNDTGSYIEQRGNTLTTGSDRFRIQSSVQGDAVNYSSFRVDPQSGFAFEASGTANGKVGIGTTNPASKLHMSSGTMTIDGNVPASLKVTGSIQVGVDATACTAANAGAMRYNAGTMEFCNGSAWGPIGGGGSVPAGTIVYSTLTVCPSGWSVYSTANGRYLLAVDPATKSTGTVVGTVLSQGENRSAGSHNHPITDPGHNHLSPGTVYTGALGCTNGWVSGPFCDTSLNTGSKTTGITVDATGGSVAGTNAPYIQLLACLKN